MKLNQNLRGIHVETKLKQVTILFLLAIGYTSSDIATSEPYKTLTTPRNFILKPLPNIFVLAQDWDLIDNSRPPSQQLHHFHSPRSQTL